MRRENNLKSQGGINIYSFPNPSSHGFYLSLTFRAGCMYEGEGECGITHFFEHIAIRNINKLMGGELYRTLDREGIEFNASTYGEMVQFYITGAKSEFRRAAEIITKVLSPIILSPAEISCEAGRIKAEIRENDERGSLANFTSGIVFAGTTLSRSITGTAGGISRITKSRLEDYRKRITTPENIFLYATGAVSDADLSYLASLLDGYPLYEGEVHENIAPVPEKFGKRECKVHIKSADFTMVRFTFDMDMSKISGCEADLIYDLLLSGYASKLFIEMSENRGLCYDLSGAVERYTNIGTFTFAFEVGQGKLYDAVELTLGILEELGTHEISSEEMMKAGYVKNSELLLDDIRELNFTLSYDNHIMGEGYQTLKERADAYDAVTPERLMLACRELFKPQNLTLTMKGNKKKIDAERIKKILEGFRK